MDRAATHSTWGVRCGSTGKGNPKQVRGAILLRMLAKAVLHCGVLLPEGVDLLILGSVVRHSDLVEPGERHESTISTAFEKLAYGFSGDFWNCLKSNSW